MEKINRETLAEEILDAKDQLELSSMKLAEVQEKLHMIDDEISDCTGATQRAVRRLNQTEAEINDLREAMSQFANEDDVVLELTAKLTEMDALHNEGKLHLASLNAQIQVLSDQRKKYRDIMDNLKDELRRLEARLETAKALRSDFASAAFVSTSSSIPQAQGPVSAEYGHPEEEEVLATPNEIEASPEILLQELWSVQSLLANERAKVVELELQIQNSNGSATQDDLDRGRYRVSKLQHSVADLEAAIARSREYQRV